MKFSKNWRDLKKSRKISILLEVSLLIASIIISMISILTYLSIESFLYNVEVPSDNPEINMDISDPDKMYVKVPYEIKNKGYFDIVHIYMNVTIDIVYTSNKTNEETRRTIFSKEELIGYCHPNKRLVDNFEGDSGDFDIDELGLYKMEVDTSKDIERFMDLTISADLYGLVHFHIQLEDIDLDEDYSNGCNC